MPIQAATASNTHRLCAQGCRRPHPSVVSPLPTLSLLQKCHKSYSTGLPETCSSGQSNWNEAAAHPASYKLHMYLFAILTCGPGTLISDRSQYWGKRKQNKGLICYGNSSAIINSDRPERDSADDSALLFCRASCRFRSKKSLWSCTQQGHRVSCSSRGPCFCQCTCCCRHSCSNRTFLEFNFMY